MSRRSLGIILVGFVMVSLVVPFAAHSSPVPTAPTVQPTAPQAPAKQQSLPETVAPQDLYHITWSAIPQLAYNTDKLGNWQDYAHKFCKDIKSDEDAIKYANKMLESLDDPYTVLHTAKQMQELSVQITGTTAGIGVRFAVDKTVPAGSPPKPARDADGNPLIEKVSDGGAAKDAGINDGDAIVSANGKALAGLGFEELSGIIRDKVGTKVKLVYRHKGTDVTVDIVRREVKLPPVELPTKRFGKVGYLYLPNFTSNATVAELRDALKKLSDCDAYIFDERHNPGGQIGVCLNAIGLFMDKGTITKMRRRVPSAGYSETVVSLEADCIKFTETDEATGKKQVNTIPRQANLTGNKPMVLLTDGASMSASEMLAGCLKDNDRAILVGETTGGKGIGQEIFPLPNGTGLRVTNLRYFTPKGTWVGDGHKECHGIAPHHQVKLSDVKTIATEKDDQLALALKVLSEKLAR